MRVALIPPVGLLRYAISEPLQMIIPEGLRTQAYRDFYRAQSKVQGVSIMLDNGAFEAEGGWPLSNDRLVKYVYEYVPQFFVMPDRMGDWQGTVAAVRNFLHYWDVCHVLKDAPPIQFLAVLQGVDDYTIKRCADDFAKTEEEFEISFVFGIPKWMTKELEVSTRIRMANWLHDNLSHPVHLLGMSHNWPREVLFAAQSCPDVISVDTSAPFVYAMQGLQLTTNGGAERPEPYFTAPVGDVDEGLVWRNIAVVKSWADGREA